MPTEPTPQGTPPSGRPRLGLIQSRGIGDILIALPIAKHWHDAGWDVFWPIDARFLPSFKEAASYVNFIPFEFDSSFNGFVMTPLKLLKAQGCGKIFTLYSYLSNAKVSDQTLFASLKFDEYKYAISGVPFSKKWELSITRNPEREQALYERLVRQEDYVVVHSEGSNCRVAHTLPPELAKFQVIEIGQQSDSIFDWLGIIGKAHHLFMLDSCFSNLVEQLNLTTPKTLYLRSEARFTPVYKNGWKFEASVAAK